VTSATTPRRDRARPYRFTTTGRVAAPPACPAGAALALGAGTCLARPARPCTGTVTVRFKRRNATISTRRVRLRSDCRYRYRSRVTLNARGRRRLGTLRVLVRYGGNAVLAPRAAAVSRVGGRVSPWRADVDGCSMRPGHDKPRRRNDATCDTTATSDAEAA
jgi:hypothetical protein